MELGVCELLWLKIILEDHLKIAWKGPMKLYYNKKSTIDIAHNPIQHNHTKHVEIHQHFIKEKLEDGIICFPFIPSTQQTTNILTKGLLQPNFEHLINKLGMIDIYAPT